MSVRRLAILRPGLAIVLATLPLTAVRAVEPANICDFYAYTADADPSGTNVRSGPGTDHPIVATLPQSFGPDEFTPQFHVLGFSDGWLQIEDVAVGQYDDGPDEVLFQGPGWISARLVGFDIEDLALWAAPSADAAPLEDLMTEPWTVNGVRVDTIHGCQGSFVEVTISGPGERPIRGWAGDICGNQATTCS